MTNNTFTYGIEQDGIILLQSQSSSETPEIIEQSYTQIANAINNFTSITRQGLSSISDEISYGFSDLSFEISSGVERLDNSLMLGFSEIARTLKCGFDNVCWEISQNTEVLKKIDFSIKNPAFTAANEWRKIGEDERKHYQLESSERFFLKALDSFPGDYRTHVGLALTYIEMDKPSQAMECLEKSLVYTDKASLPSYCKSYSYRLMSHVKYSQGLFDEAAEHLGQSLLHTPEYDYGHYDLARCLAKLNKADRSITELKKALLINPRLIAIAKKDTVFSDVNLNNLIPLSTMDYFARSYPKGAKGDSPMLKSYLYRLMGYAEYSQKHYREAVHYLNQSVDFVPDYSYGNYDLAKYIAKTDSASKSPAFLEKAILIEPQISFVAKYDTEFERTFGIVNNVLDKLCANERSIIKRMLMGIEEVRDQAFDAWDKRSEFFFEYGEPYKASMLNSSKISSAYKLPVDREKISIEAWQVLNEDLTNILEKCRTKGKEDSYVMEFSDVIKQSQYVEQIKKDLRTMNDYAALLDLRLTLEKKDLYGDFGRARDIAKLQLLFYKQVRTSKSDQRRKGFPPVLYEQIAQLVR